MEYQNKNTKIVATISDRKCEPDFIQNLYDHGMNVVRLNTAHQNEEETLKVIENVRKVSDKIAILVDTKGPEVRTVNIEEPIEFKQGEHVTLTGPKEEPSTKEMIQLTSDVFANVPEGAHVLIDDGAMKLTVIEKRDEGIYCHIDNAGTIKTKKSVNFPNCNINLPSLTERDKKYIEFAIKHNLDFIAHSFIRSKEDCLAVQEILDKHDSDIKIISKIENRQGVNNIKEILDHSFGVMVARGDLGVEIPAAEVPYVQKYMIRECIKKGKPVIVATQMLESMIDNPRATRAEVSDVANAILDGASALMLSGETAYGKHPVEAVRTMSEVALDLADKKAPYLRWLIERPASDRRWVVVKSIVHMSEDLDAKAIVIPSATGKTAQIVGAFHGRRPVYAYCYTPRVMRELALCYGVKAELTKECDTTDQLVADTLQQMLDANHAGADDLVIVGATTPKRRDQPVNFIEVDTIGNALESYNKGR